MVKIIILQGKYITQLFCRLLQNQFTVYVNNKNTLLLWAKINYKANQQGTI